MFLDCLQILYSLVLLPCLPEIIVNMPLLELKQNIKSLKKVLKDCSSVYYESIIYDFFKRVVQLRSDAAHLLEDEMSAAKHHLEGPIWKPELMQNPLDLIVQPDIFRGLIKLSIEKAVRSTVWLELYSCLTILRHSSNTYNRLAFQFYETELLAHPKHLSSKQQKSMAEDMLRLSKDDLAFRTQFLDCIGRFVELYPTMMEKVKTELSRFLVDHMDSRAREKTVNVMRNLFALLQSFKVGKSPNFLNVGRNDDFFKEILVRTMLFLNDKDPNVRLYAIKIYGEIARRCRCFPRSTIAWAVKMHFPGFLVSLHSCNLEISMSAAVCIKHCLPHMFGRAASLRLHPCMTVVNMDTDSTHIQDIYTYLQSRGLLKSVLDEAIDNVGAINDCDSFIKHVCLLRDMIPHSKLYPTDLYTLWMGLKKGVDSKTPYTRDTAKAASKALGEKWESLATVRPAEPLRPGERFWLPIVRWYRG